MANINPNIFTMEDQLSTGVPNKSWKTYERSGYIKIKLLFDLIHRIKSMNCKGDKNYDFLKRIVIIFFKLWRLFR